MKKKHIIKSGKRLVNKIKSIKESTDLNFINEGKIEDLKKSWSAFVDGARREG